jgi:methylglutaconyl-CoA hydratase
MGGELLEERRDEICLLALHRPSCRNALTSELIAELRQRIEAALDAPQIKAVVLTGSPPAFCAGLDLNAFGLNETTDRAQSAASTRDASPQLREANEALFDLYERIHAAPKPMVAAVNGAAVAGGAGLVTACDFAVAARSAKIGYPAIKKGLVAAVVMRPLIQRVDAGQARRMLLDGELLSAGHALRCGLVDEVVDDDRVVDRAVALARRLAIYPAAAYATTKQWFDAVVATGGNAWSENVRETLSRMEVFGSEPESSA